MRETVQGLNKLMKDISKLERIPQKQITKGARKGANVILKQARAKAPKLTGTMRKGIYLKAEKSKRGKKVFQITFRSKPEFVKVTKDGTRYFYPASQEFGFRTRDGGRVEGKHFMLGAMEENKNEAAETMVQVIGEEIEKALSEGSLR